MKKALLSTAALICLTAGAVAADLPPRAAPSGPIVVPSFFWTGFYVGLNGGYAFAEESQRGRLVTPNGAGGTFTVRRTPGNSSLTGNTDDNGAGIGGGQAGYNMQFGIFVAGLETDIQLLGIGDDQFYGQMGLATARGPQPTGTFGISAPTVASGGRNVAFFSQPQQLDYFGTVRGRLGVAYDRLLVFATGGLAWTDVDDANRNIPDAAFFTSPTAFNRAKRIANSSGTESEDIGWTVGGGVEYAFTRNLSARIEGLYVAIGDKGGSNIVGVTNRGQAIRQTGGGDATTEFGLVRGGVNFRFDSF